LRVYDTAEGLMPTQARAIAQTADGYIWLAAFEGVVRFDGSRAFVFSGKNTPILPVPLRTETVFVDRNSRLWTATGDGRLFCFDEINWLEYGKRDGWPNLVVNSIAEAPDGTMFFGGSKKIDVAGAWQNLPRLRCQRRKLTRATSLQLFLRQPIAFVARNR